MTNRAIVIRKETTGKIVGLFELEYFSKLDRANTPISEVIKDLQNEQDKINRKINIAIKNYKLSMNQGQNLTFVQEYDNLKKCQHLRDYFILLKDKEWCFDFQKRRLLILQKKHGVLYLSFERTIDPISEAMEKNLRDYSIMSKRPIHNQEYYLSNIQSLLDHQY